jgi:hypothetical protein
MKRKRYSVEQIVAAVKQHKLGASAAESASKLGIEFCKEAMARQATVADKQPEIGERKELDYTRSPRTASRSSREPATSAATVASS